MRRPSGEALADGDASSAVMPRAHPDGSAPLVYTLKRGRTAAVVEGMEWAHGKTWLGMSTRRRTIHAFAVTHSVTSLTGVVISRTRPGLVDYGVSTNRTGTPPLCAGRRYSFKRPLRVRVRASAWGCTASARVASPAAAVHFSVKD
ncbi:hypothetical protein VTO73DRAFT_10253 [Trametes versicolor]